MFFQKAQDAAFYDMVHEMVHNNQLLQDATQAQSPGHERRTEDRFPYPYTQLVAPYDGGRLPDQSEFRHVQCQNISTRGFSYFDTSRPTYNQVVMLFGRIPFRIFTAEVRHVRKTSRPDLVLVGCRILARLSK